MHASNGLAKLHVGSIVCGRQEAQMRLDASLKFSSRFFECWMECRPLCTCSNHSVILCVLFFFLCLRNFVSSASAALKLSHMALHIVIVIVCYYYYHHNCTFRKPWPITFIFWHAGISLQFSGRVRVIRISRSLCHIKVIRSCQDCVCVSYSRVVFLRLKDNLVIVIINLK